MIGVEDHSRRVIRIENNHTKQPNHSSIHSPIRHKTQKGGLSHHRKRRCCSNQQQARDHTDRWMALQDFVEFERHLAQGSAFMHLNTDMVWNTVRHDLFCGATLQ